MTGSFYEPELQKTTQEIFRIEKVIRRERKRALVKWSGYPDQFNSWVPMSELKKLMLLAQLSNALDSLLANVALPKVIAKVIKVFKIILGMLKTLKENIKEILGFSVAN